MDDVDLAVHAGEFVCVYGASGAGKSTLAQLAGLIAVADAGQIRVMGEVVSSTDPRRRAWIRRTQIGVVFQHHNLIEELSALENVALALELAGIGRKQAQIQAAEALELIGIGGLKDRRPDQLSGGQQQRVGVARAWCGNRPIIIADEPTGSLDTENSAAIFSELRALCDRGTAVVLATHDEEGRAFADTIYEMVDGRLQEKRRPDPR